MKKGILNPHLNSLLAKFRHTNSLVIADRGFPSWPKLETVDLSIVDDLPTVLQVLKAIRPNLSIAKAYMASEFKKHNNVATRAAFARSLEGIPLSYEVHAKFKGRVPGSVGLVRTGDTIQYANMILISG